MFLFDKQNTFPLINPTKFQFFPTEDQLPSSLIFCFVDRRPTKNTSFPHSSVLAVCNMSPSKPSRAAIDEVRNLESNFHSQGLSASNNLLPILSHLTPTSSACTKAIHAARRILTTLTNATTLSPELSSWLSTQQSKYTTSLQTLLTNPSSSTSITDAVVAAAALSSPSVWSAIVQTSLQNPDSHYAHLVFKELSVRFADLRTETLLQIADLSNTLFATLLLNLLSTCTAIAPVQTARGKAVSELSLRRAAVKCWMALIRRSDLNDVVLCEALGRLPKELLPYMDDPLSMADMLICAYDSTNTTVAIAALDGLFVLISKHSLDYPRFYHKLYSLMTEETMFYAQSRERFLELTAAFLRFGTNLSGTIVAAFVKRLLRRALVAPAAGALWALRLALELLYKHHTLHTLVHRSVNLFESTGEDEGKEKEVMNGKDSFDDTENDPEKSHAEESSLWELEILKHHLSPAVSRLVAAFAKDVRKNPPPPPGDLADYHGLTFEDLFQAEVKRKAKSVHLAYEEPGSAPHLERINKELNECISWS